MNAQRIGDPRLVEEAAGAVAEHTRWVDDFPTAGVRFADLTPVFADGPSFSAVIAALASAAPDAELVAGIDARGNLQSVYPDESGETNRFKRGTPEQPSVKRFDLPWLDAAGDARLLVMAVPATPYSAPRLFGVGQAQAGPSGDKAGQ